MLTWHTALAFALGAAAGALLMYLLRHRLNDTQALRRRLADVQADLEAYRAEVDAHFERTSDLFQEVTRKYRSLHDHLAQGATGLTRGTRRLTSIELPEKTLLPERGEAPVDPSSPAAPDDTVPASDGEAPASRPEPPVEDTAAEDVARSEPSLAGEETPRR